MDSIASWNIRGLNRPLKQREVHQIVTENSLSVCAVLESHVEVSKISKVCRGVFKNWNWTSNGRECPKGARIIVGWNDDEVDLMVLNQTDQVMHVQISSKSNSKVFLCSFIYAKNTYQERRLLWRDLCKHKLLAHDKPWIVMGDFNSALYAEDLSANSSAPTIGMRDFFECVQNIEMLDIKSHGMHFTWNQKPKTGLGILKKIDRVMGNVEVLDVFPDAYVLYHPYRISDHTPCILRLNGDNRKKHKPFKFVNFIASKEGFKKCVAEEWSKRVEGITMLSVVKKLRNLKSPLRKLLYQQGNLHKRVIEKRHQLDEIHKQIDQNPTDVNLRGEEARLVKEFQNVAYEEELFLKQKAKAEWLRVGDGNTSFFHNSVKSRNARNKIHVIKDASGNIYEGKSVENALVNHYVNFLGMGNEVDKLEVDNLFTKVLQPDVASHMVRQVTRDEVKVAMFGIGDNKAPGPDGYMSVFFKKSWDIVGEEVSNAILQFFENGKLLNQINHTIIALVPKVTTPTSVLEYRPISCCNVILKCISKIISNRIKGSLESLVDINQSAFIPGRKISDNILLTQELMHNYHLRAGKPRCAFKIDIQKAYDSVNWSFLNEILLGFGFPLMMVKWIMTCVTTVSYSLSINGNLCGYFKGKRGLRQGDPLSPYLFTLVMEVLSLLLHRHARLNPAFRYHPHCKKQKIINVSFADDLFIFVNADPHSVRVVRDGLNHFSRISGLTPNMNKSTAYFCNVSTRDKQVILSILPFKEGELPVRYLGVPLISTRVVARDCKVLVDNLEKKVDNWMNKTLSFAGRLQLIKSVMSSMHTYWASVFMLLSSVIKDIEKLMRNFLWSGGSKSTVKPKVAWKEVCMPKNEGGLGIRCLSDVNKGLLSNHIWSLITKRESLWVKWIHSYRIKGRNFWDIACGNNASWGWRKILSIRDTVRPFFWYILGDGRRVNAWSDNWCVHSPLRELISPRRIHNAGFTMQTLVADLVNLGGWTWPAAWFDIFPVLNNVEPPNLEPNTRDNLIWKDNQGNEKQFSSAEVWDTIRTRRDVVPWVDLVWYPQCIPRHSFHMWLVIKDKLKTQDRMRSWDAGSETNLNLMCCPLCQYGKDSRDHLFFQCHFSLQVWNKVKHMAYMEMATGRWDSIMDEMLQQRNSNTICIVRKMVVAASTYFIWQERNNRLFSQIIRNSSKVANLILHTVRLKLMTFKVGHDVKNPLGLERWKSYVKEGEEDPG